MLRVAFFMNRFPVSSETFVMNTAAGLLAAGHGVDLYGFWGPGVSAVHHGMEQALLPHAYPIRLADAGPGRRWLAAPAALTRVVHKAGLRTALSGLNLRVHRRRGLTANALHELDAFQGQGRYDVLHSHFATLAEAVLRHRRAGGLEGAVVVHFRGHDISSHVERHGPDCYDRVFREADAFIANSAFFRDRVVALGAPADRVSIVESPINMDLFPFTPPTWEAGKPVRVLTVGRLTEKKGIRYAIEAVALLRERGWAVEHRILGEGLERRALEDLIRSRGLARTVALLGERSQEEVAAELSRADLFVAPSVRGTDGAEDAAINTIKEAMASGVPVLSTFHGGIPELVEHGVSGLLAPERDARALADHMESLLRAPGRWPGMAAAGRRAVEERFSIPAITSRIVRVYDQATLHYRERRTARRGGR